MNRNQPLRQYANRSQSGTVTTGGMRRDPNEAIIDRVMMIAQRVVAAENTVKNQASEIAKLKETVKNLNEKIEDYTAPSIVKDAKTPKPRAAKRRKPSAALQEEVAKLTETTED